MEGSREKQFWKRTHKSNTLSNVKVYYECVVSSTEQGQQRVRQLSHRTHITVTMSSYEGTKANEKEKVSPLTNDKQLDVHMPKKPLEL